MKRSLIDITEFSVEEIDELLKTACDISENPKKYAEVCHGKYPYDRIPEDHPADEIFELFSLQLLLMSLLSLYLRQTYR